jgi:uncharacterized protein YigE (DUF2233 family)
LSSDLARSDQRLVFAMNGGMYHDDLLPVGLYVEGEVEKSGISTRGGRGNFHLLPNGVLFFGNRGNGPVAGVMETRAFLKSGLKPGFATQSGPMLVIDGKLHHRFLPKSDSFKMRNGVGVSADGETLYFAISTTPVRFWDFGTLFRDVLNTPNALFLDGGSASTIHHSGRSRFGYADIGPIVAVTEASTPKANSPFRQAGSALVQGLNRLATFDK